MWQKVGTVKISKVLADTIADLEHVLVRLREVKARHDHAVADLAGDAALAVPTVPVVPTPLVPPVVVPEAPIPPPAHATVLPVASIVGIPVPIGSDRVIPNGVWAAVDQYAPSERVNPDVLLSIEVWETGWFTSDAWRFRRNPGGMKDPPASFAAHGLVTDRDLEHPTYMRFASWQEGIRGHATFIGEGPRYAAIHATNDPDRQIEAIGAAGYAEGSDSWRVGVKAKYRQVVALRAKRAGTRPVTTPAPTDVGAAILVSAKKAQDLGTGFPYEPETEGGNLGCANVVAWILRDAGILMKLILNVDGVVDALTALGWREVAAPYQDGDVIAWRPWAGSNGHQHIGILDEDGSKVWAYNNSSGQRKVVVENLAGDSRPIRCVLRHP